MKNWLCMICLSPADMIIHDVSTLQHWYTALHKLEHGALQPCIDKAKHILQHSQFIYFQCINSGYIQMTKSWICNVKKIGTILDRTVIVATDKQSYQSLKQFEPDLNVFLFEYESRHSMQYFYASYWRYVYLRTHIVQQFLHNNISLWMVESDSVWFDDPSKQLQSVQDHDIVAIHDDITSHNLGIGFILLNVTQDTVAIWDTMVKQLDYNVKEGKVVIEQDTLFKIIQESKARVKWLDIRQFPCGKWYDDKYTFHGLPFRFYANEPIVIQNNYIVGNEAKIQRAKKWGHWYHNGVKDECIIH